MVIGGGVMEGVVLGGRVWSLGGHWEDNRSHDMTQCSP